MKIVVNRELAFDSDLYDVVLVGMGLRWGVFGSFQWRMTLKYPEIVELDHSGGFNDYRRLGTRLTLHGKPTISLMYYHRKRPTSIKQDYVCYPELEQCLATANAEFKGQKVATIIAGASPFDGNGDREKCLGLLEKCLKDVDLYVYDYEITSPAIERKEANDLVKKLSLIGENWKERFRSKDNIIKFLQLAKEKKQREMEIEYLDLCF